MNVPPDKLLAVPVDKLPFYIDNSYESIKAAVEQATIDFCIGPGMGMFIDDNGMVDGRMLNVPASVMMQRPLYGHTVLTAMDPTDEGDTLPPEPALANATYELATIWYHVRRRARAIGQTLDVFADPNFLPMPTIVALPDEWVPGDGFPQPLACPECGSADKNVMLPPCDNGANDWHEM